MSRYNSDTDKIRFKEKQPHSINNKNFKNNSHLGEENKIILNKKCKKSKKISKNKNKYTHKENGNNLQNNTIIDLNEEFKSNSNNLKYFKDLVKDSYTITYSDNSFIIFKSFNNILYSLYSNKNNSILCFNILDNKKIIEIRKPHKEKITNFRHHLDDYNERDLLLSISSKDNNLKVWYFQNFECIFNFENINKNGYLNSACFLNDKNDIYILSSHYRFSARTTEPIKIFDLKGNKIKEVEASNETTVFLDTFYDKKLNKKFIITGNFKYVKSFDYENNCIYKVYDDSDYKYHDSIVVLNNNETKIKMFESSGDGNIRVWDFHKAKLIKKIRVNKTGIYGICLWNKDYIFVGSKKTLKLVNIKSEDVDITFRGHTNEIVTLKKFIHPIYGECLLSQAREEYSIKLWKIDI